MTAADLKRMIADLDMASAAVNEVDVTFENVKTLNVVSDAIGRVRFALRLAEISAQTNEDINQTIAQIVARPL